MEADLDELDARAEAIGGDSSSEFEPSSEASSGASSSNHELSRHAAVGPGRFAGAKRARSEASDPDEKISLRDLRNAQKTLFDEHKLSFNTMIERLNQIESLEEGDDIDLNTGSIVQNRGHLQALNGSRTRSRLLIGLESESDDESEAEEIDGIAAAEARRDGVEFVAETKVEDVLVERGTDPLYLVCETGSPLLDHIVKLTRGHW